MTFDDVEKARQAYLNKRNCVKKKALWITLGVEFAVILIAVIVNVGLFQRVFAGPGNFSFVLVTPLMMTLLFLTILPIIIVAVIISISTRNELTQYKKAYKRYFVGQELARTFTDLKYNHEVGLDKQILNSTQMINTGDRYSSNDLTTGKYKNVAFTQADVRIEEEHEDSDGNTTYVTIFRGRFMIFEFPKKFNFKLEVFSKFFSARRIPGKNPETGRKFEKLEVESTDFNKKFKIYAEDGFEMFYLLDPALIDRVERLATAYGKKMILCFVDNKLYVGINEGKDAFEPPRPFEPIDEKTEIEKVHGDIKLITDFVDELRLDHKIFS